MKNLLSTPNTSSSSSSQSLPELFQTLTTPLQMSTVKVSGKKKKHFFFSLLNNLSYIIWKCRFQLLRMNPLAMIRILLLASSFWNVPLLHLSRCFNNQHPTLQKCWKSFKIHYLNKNNLKLCNLKKFLTWQIFFFLTFRKLFRNSFSNLPIIESSLFNE